jgi:site-specific DNA-methyltransferase (adenine-specific)
MSQFVARSEIIQGDNLEALRGLEDAAFDLVYVDPPFNTGRAQLRRRLRTVADAEGDRTGFAGKRFRTEEVGSAAFSDSFDDYLAFLEPRLVEARRVLKPDGSFFLHVDYREVHYCKVLLDSIFGRECFMNEIVWAYDYGARSRKKWPAKHDNILWYVRDPSNYVFNYDEMDRIPYMAPGLVTREKAALGKTPTDVWWHTIVSPTGREKTGWPTQKPLGVLERIVKVHSRPGDVVLDFFAGSGTTGVASVRNGRSCVLVDIDPCACEIMRERLAAETGAHRAAPSTINPDS